MSQERSLSVEHLQKIREIEIRTRKMVENVFTGEYHTVFKGQGMEFAEVRPYQPGDDVRVMDWNVTARTGAPFIKVFREERELTLILMVDLSASGAFGSEDRFKVEVAAELAAALAFSAIRNNDKVGLIGFTDRVELYVPPKKGKTHVMRLIREILFFEPEGRDTDLMVAFDYLNRVVKKKAICFMISDFFDAGYERGLSATEKKHDLIALRLIDPREESLPDVGLITLRDQESGERLVVDTSRLAVRSGFALAARKRAASLASLFARAGCDEVLIRLDEDPVAPLVRFFKKREKRLRIG